MVSFLLPLSFSLITEVYYNTVSPNKLHLYIQSTVLCTNMYINYNTVSLSGVTFRLSQYTVCFDSINVCIYNMTCVYLLDRNPFVST